MSNGSALPLEMKDVSVARDGQRILDRVDAGFRSDRVTAVIGPSGAGKTTLLRCLNRLEEPSTGRVLFHGRDVREAEPTDLRKRVGMIFQLPTLFEGRVRNNLLYGLEDVDDSLLTSSLEAAGLSASFLDRSSAGLSVGQAQRACIARALVRGPEVLLMDEPTSALDKDASARIEELIRELRVRRLAVVLVTHNLEQAKRVADEAVLLHEGRVLAAGAPDEVASFWPGPGS